MAEDESASIFDRESGVLDRIENRIESEGSSRPMREALEDGLDGVPDGPLGKGGEGDIVGAITYVAVRSGQLAVLPIPGVRQPGFHVISHGVEDKGEFERHSIRISAASANVAQFVAEYEVAAPSNIDFVSAEIETVSIEPITERTTFTTWDIQVDVAERGQKEA